MRGGVDEARALEQITFARRLGLSVTALDMLSTHAPPGSPLPAEAVERVQAYTELLRSVSSGSAEDRHGLEHPTAGVSGRAQE